MSHSNHPHIHPYSTPSSRSSHPLILQKTLGINPLHMERQIRHRLGRVEHSPYCSPVLCLANLSQHSHNTVTTPGVTPPPPVRPRFKTAHLCRAPPLLHSPPQQQQVHLLTVEHRRLPHIPTSHTPCRQTGTAYARANFGAGGWVTLKGRPFEKWNCLSSSRNSVEGDCREDRAILLSVPRPRGWVCVNRILGVTVGVWTCAFGSRGWSRRRFQGERYVAGAMDHSWGHTNRVVVHCRRRKWTLHRLNGLSLTWWRDFVGARWFASDFNVVGLVLGLVRSCLRGSVIQETKGFARRTLPCF